MDWPLQRRETAKYRVEFNFRVLYSSELRFKPGEIDEVVVSVGGRVSHLVGSGQNVSFITSSGISLRERRCEAAHRMSRAHMKLVVRDATR